MKHHESRQHRQIESPGRGKDTTAIEQPGHAQVIERFSEGIDWLDGWRIHRRNVPLVYHTSNPLGRSSNDHVHLIIEHPPWTNKNRRMAAEPIGGKALQEARMSTTIQR